MKPELKAAWNTGRLYKACGQRIAAQFDSSQGRIYFSDIDRGIDGWIPCSNAPRDVHALQHLTLANYDGGNYTGYIADRDIARGLAEFAAIEVK